MFSALKLMQRELGPAHIAAASATGNHGTVGGDRSAQSPERSDLVAQEPVAGTPVPRGTKVTLSVSKGPSTSQVPDVTLQTQSDAEALLRGAGFEVATATQDVTDPASDGVVLAQDPEGGTPLTKGGVVTITVGSLTAGGAETLPSATSTTTTTTPAPTTP